MKRSGLVAASSAVLLLSAVAAPALADTAAQPADSYVSGGAFSFVDQGQTWSGFAQLEDDRLHGTLHVSLFFGAPGAEKVCDSGTPGDPTDDYTGTEFIEFDQTTTRIVDASVRSDLGAAKFSVQVSGVRSRFDACTGEIIQAKREHHSFEMALKSTSALQTDSGSIQIDNGDGTLSPGTETFSFRTAAGKASVDSSPASVSDALIQHVVITKN